MSGKFGVKKLIKLDQMHHFCAKMYNFNTLIFTRKKSCAFI